jgi:glycosyltransferase involved in cell wall biosynthesis
MKMKKKKVLVVATVAKAHIIAFHIPYLKWFKENGYETHVCAKNDFKNKKECNIPYCDNYYDLPFERSPIKKGNYRTYKLLKQLINTNEFDIIHCHTPMGGVLTRLAVRNMEYKKTKVIYTAHGFHFYKGAPMKNWMIYYPIEKWLAKYTDVLITINKEDYSKALKFKTKEIKYVPGVGIDTKKIDKIKVNEIKKRNEVGIKEDSTLILSVGELNRNKNHETIIRAIARLADPNVLYIICGEGSLKPYLKKLVIELGIEKQVKLLGYRTDIAEIAKISDIFAFPSFREGLSLSLMEAMSAGLPVICSAIRGNSDLIHDGRGGYSFKPNNIEDFSNSINELKQNTLKRKEMGKYNKRIISSFDIQQVINDMGEIYLEVED